MKKAFLSLSLLVSFQLCFSQITNTYVYDMHGNLINGTHIKLPPHTIKALVDTLTSDRFILDTAHINICALNAKGDTLWKTDPWKDNNIPVYRVRRPRIVDFHFENSQYTGNKEVIWIVYFNTQFGYLDKATGKFTFLGQD